MWSVNLVFGLTGGLAKFNFSALRLPGGERAQCQSQLAPRAYCELKENVIHQIKKNMTRRGEGDSMCEENQGMGENATKIK